jgi:hypothetical protein
MVYKKNGGKCSADSAFAAKKCNFIVWLLGTVDIEANDRLVLPNRLLVNQEATSIQQSAEWGMSTMKASFPRLRDLLIFDEYGERNVILVMITLLYNLRARKLA